jgi:hypothetical protein
MCVQYGGRNIVPAGTRLIEDGAKEVRINTKYYPVKVDINVASICYILPFLGPSQLNFSLSSHQGDRSLGSQPSPCLKGADPDQNRWLKRSSLGELQLTL